MASSPADRAYIAQVKAVRARVEAFALSRFGAGQYRDADLERFVKQVVPVVLAGRRQVSALTDAYLSRKLGIRSLGPIDTDALRGVLAAEVYARPFVTVRTKLSEGMDFADAVKAGAARVTDIALTDLQLAKTHTTRTVYRSAGVKRYIRTLTGTKNCALCTVASTQTYSTDDLLPIHPGCDCGTDVAPKGFDGSARLEGLHEAVEDLLGGTDRSGRDIGFGDEHKDFTKLVVTREHGEMGPVLTRLGQHFDGPSVVS